MPRTRNPYPAESSGIRSLHWRVPVAASRASRESSSLAPRPSQVGSNRPGLMAVSGMTVQPAWSARNWRACARRGAHGHLRVHRGLVQSEPPPFGPRLQVTHGIRKGRANPAKICYRLTVHETGGTPKSYWNKVGAAWKHKDGRGYTLQLETCPINGRIILRLPLEDAPETANDAGRA